MHDIKALCKRVFVIHKGSSLYDGNFEELVNLVNPQRKLVFEFSNLPRKEAIQDLSSRYSFDLKDNFINAELPEKELTALVSELFKLDTPISITLEDLPVEDTMRTFFSEPHKFLE